MRRRLTLLVWLTTLVGAAGCGTGPGPTAEPAVTAGSASSASAARPAAESPPAPGKPREITFDDIKLDMQKDEAFEPGRLTPRVRELERQRVRIRGYILPSFQQSGLTQFVLVRDNQECCFGPGAALHDCVVVRMRPGTSAEFSIRPVAVEGTFRVEELRGPDGRHLAIYALDGERVR
jgi:hypothetical protein